MIKFRGREQTLAERQKTDMERTETTFTFHIERTRGQIRFEPVKDSASYCKPRGKTRRYDVMVNSIKCSREIKKTDTIFLRAYGINEVIMDIQSESVSYTHLTLPTILRV